MLKYFRLDNQKIIESDEGNSNILIYISPTNEEKKLLSDLYQLDEHTINSALDPDELSRIEFEANHTAIIYKRPKNISKDKNLLFKVDSIGIFTLKDKIIIIMNEDISLFSSKLFQKVNSLNEVMLKLLSISISHFLEHIKVMNMITDELEKKISSSMENKYLQNFFNIEKSLVYYVNSINSNSVLIERMKNNSAKLGFSQEEIELLDDLIIDNNQCLRQAEIYSNILASLMDARVSIVSNNLNILMKTLNIITIMIMVPTLVVSVFSMNVSLPLQDLPYAFWIILCLCIISVTTVFLIWKYKKW
ncbi:MAG: magnesium transporter CorA family protein [Deltaproteobacteria bacterium]|nr:magnesium transporter CorA family protein [Deltaproteobacteria bacterium]